MREMTQRLGKWLNIYVFKKQHKYVASDLNILNMAQICGQLIKYIRRGFTMLEMA